MKRTPLARRTPLAPRKPLARGPGPTRRSRVAPMSTKRLVENAARKGVVAALLQAYPTCQARVTCQGAPAVDVHERLKRSRGGSIVDADHGHMVTICRACHEWTEAEPAAATRARLLLPSWHRCPPVGPC